MKKNILLFLLSLLFVMTAHAEDFCYQESCCVDNANYYAKMFFGANFLQNSKNRSTYHTGYVIAGSLGYCWRDGLRVEGEYAFRKNDIRKIHFAGQGSSTHGHFKTSSLMANVFWDMPLLSWGYYLWEIQPFIGAGIGYDSQKMHSSNSRIFFNQKWHHFAWQLMAGLSYPIYCNTNVSLEYKFHQGGSHFYNHALGVGVVYKFGLKL